MLLPRKTIEIFSPIAGNLVALSDVPDKAIASGAVGHGIAIEPKVGYIYSPTDAKKIHFFKTNHVISFEVGALELMVHFGIDTVKLNGKGFERIYKHNDPVDKGVFLVRCDLPFLKKNAKSIISPVLVTNMEAVSSITFSRQTGYVEIGTLLFTVTLK